MDILTNLKFKKNRDRHFRDLLSAKNKVEIEEIIFDEIFLDDVYCLMDCPKSNRENVEVLDIGGHHGYWSLLVKEIYKYQSGSPTVNCTIVEAMKDNVDIIRLIHGDDNKTEIFEAICGSKANRPEYVFTPNDHSAGAILLSGVKELERFKPNWRKKGKLSKLEKD